MIKCQISKCATALLVVLCSTNARASFHVMQIEQIIGGVNGDPMAQAIQLRMRSGGQNQMQNGTLIVRDAAGNNPIVLATFPGPVSNSALGSRILIVSPNFSQYTSPAASGDQTMSNLIPASYLAAGSLTFQDLGATIYWRVSWGGAAYTGSNAGAFTNDSNGDFGPPFASALPSTTLQAIKFGGAANAPSTTNLADYALTSGAAVFTNNNPTSFTVTTPACPACPGDFNGDLLVNGLDVQKFSSCYVNNTPGIVGCQCADQNADAVLTAADVNAFVDLLLGVTTPTLPCH